ncbi:hypothetical protein [Bacillus weihaiensis]|nr:hypothetical protein [Bacillus weihaiensis]
MKNWLTPEEMEQKRARKKQIITLSLPIISILVGVLVTLALNSFS